MGRLKFLVIGVVALLAAACSDPERTAAPDTTAVPETTAPATTTTTLRPTTTVTTLRPTTTVSTLLQLGPGDASIGGTVLGPGGPIDGATVRIERLVGKNVASTDVTTSGGGSWQLGSILGGSYRVRAFRPPEFGQSPVEAFFLAANERKTLDLRLPAIGGERIVATVTPNPPRVGQGAQVSIQLGTGRVDDQGRSAIAPRAGVLLTLVGGPGIVVESSPQVVTDGNGTGLWNIRCSAEGASTATLTVGSGVTTVKLPACTSMAAAASPTTRAR
ncbi:MAG TPA: carboxypeptidase-like regulatory domain-containing protein [Acidimicrobiales bacterium]|nr:carboxypeptidase-like regulatory domain-containing protein [Acidimicrobiales bacterium]